MNDLPLITIIIPVFNVKKYLENCIKSIINQSYNNIEILIIDDGSNDGSELLCDKIGNIDERIKIFHKTNGGLSDARNFGIKQATGKYITFIDSDDDVTEEYIEYLYRLLSENRTKMAIAAYTIVSKEKRINTGENYKEQVLSTEECLERLLCEKGFSVSAWAKLYDSSLFKNIEFPKGKLNEDNGTTYKLILQCDKIAYGNKSIYNYYKRENSITMSKFNLRKLDLIQLTDEMCDVIDKLYPNLKECTDKKRITSRFSILRQILMNPMTDEEKAIEKEIEKYIKDRKKQIFKNKKIDKRDKIALITIMIGKKFFAFSWKIYYKIKY